MMERSRIPTATKRTLVMMHAHQLLNCSWKYAPLLALEMLVLNWPPTIKIGRPKEFFNQLYQFCVGDKFV